MDTNEYITNIYFNILCDFTDLNSCESWKRTHDGVEYPSIPLFSFMMTTYNDDRLINTAINSLLKQSYTDWELIILDNSDKNDNVWKMLENAMYADKRIHAFKSEQNVGWAKGASICLKHCKGIYTTFLAADDCINDNALSYMSEILEKEAPDVLWVGVYATKYNEEGKLSVTGSRIPEKNMWCGDSDKNRIHTIAEIMRNIYYNSFFHYMKISFLKKHNIDFFEPYYGDCGGMTEAMLRAEKMIATDGIVYFLTQNTSQTAGWWLNDITQNRTAIQWHGIKNISSHNISNSLDDDLHYISSRLMRNVISGIPALCMGHCRNSYMNPVHVNGTDIITQLEELLFCDEIAEMLSISYELFPDLLYAMETIENSEYISEEIIEKSRIPHLLRLSVYGKHFNLRQKCDQIVSWLLCSENPYCIGFEYFCILLQQADNATKKDYIGSYKDIAKKHQTVPMRRKEQMHEFNFEIKDRSYEDDYVCYEDVLYENKLFPIYSIGRGSRVGNLFVTSAMTNELQYSLQVGRYTSIGSNVHIIIEPASNYKCPSQNLIPDSNWQTNSVHIRQNRQVIIMNDCCIESHVIISSGVTIGNGALVKCGSVITKDVPSYAIVSGNPAKIVGWRFSNEEIEVFNFIQWWNWSSEKIIAQTKLLCSNADSFLRLCAPAAAEEIRRLKPIDITPIQKENTGEEKIYLLIPDFEQDYPIWKNVIDSFAKSYSDTNYELVIYVQEDENTENHITELQDVFSNYEEYNCYINLHVGTLSDMRSLFAQVNAYITTHNKENITYMDMAKLFDVEIISGFGIPIFEELKTDTLVHGNETDSQTHTDAYADKSVFENAMAQIADRINQILTDQYIMNCTINNIKYEVSDYKTDIHPAIEPFDITIEKIINEKKSICRFGDGEFDMIAKRNRQKFQTVNEKLAKRLKEVLTSNDDRILIAIADNYGDLSKYNNQGKSEIRTYLKEEIRNEHYALLDMSRTYCNTYLTRPYAMWADNMTDAPQKRFESLKRIWDKQKLLIIEGEQTRMGIGNDLFNNALDIQRILAPAENAFDKYDELLEFTLHCDKDRLVLISLGMTATVLAYDLAKSGFHALDIGHIDMEYEWMKRQTGSRTQVEGKYNNEVAGGNIVAAVSDSVYESQIIARIV